MSEGRFAILSNGSTSSRNALLLGGVALGSAAITAAAIFGAQGVSRRKKRRELRDSVKHAERRLKPSFNLKDETAASSTDGGTPRYLAHSSLRRSHTAPTWDESLIREQLSRNYSFLGDQGMAAIRSSFVIVVGAGGVGSWAALMLLRSGVGKLRLIDFDQVSLSSLNRHACANLADVGRPKVVCCAEKFAEIAPWATMEAWVELFCKDEADRLLGGNPTYVVDAIDNIDTKVELLRYCAERGIKVISSMGAGAKSDPSRVQISDISTTSEDPLARSVRRRLRALGIPPIPPKEVDEQPQPKKQTLKAEHAPLTKSPLGVSPAKTSRNPSGVQPLPRAMHSRRASSTSSFGSGVYSTPLTTPSDEMAALLPENGDEAALAPLDAAIAEEADDASPPAAVVAPPAPAPTPATSTTQPPRHASKPSEVHTLSPTSSPALSRSTSVLPTPSYFIPCVYSTEKSDTRLLPLSEEEFARGSVDELAALEDFRVRILPVLGPLPAMFGLAVATYILCDLAGHPQEPLAFKGRRKLYEKIFNDLAVSESRLTGQGRAIPFSVNDVAYLFEEVFRGRSVVPPHETLPAAQLERWDSTLPLSYSNVALFTRKQAKVHEREVLAKGRSPTEVWGDETARMVKRRMASERVSGFFR